MAVIKQLLGSGDEQYQRTANPLEEFLNLLQKPVQAIAGATDSALAGENPLEGAGRYMRENQDFIALLRNRGMDELSAAGLGTVANFAADPFTYLGVGQLTKAGKLAREAQMAMELGPAVGAKRFIEAGKTLNEVGEYGLKWSEQMAAKQRALVSFAGQPIVYGDRMTAKLEQLGVRMKDTPVGRAFGVVFGNKPVISEADQLAFRERKGRIAKENAALALKLGTASQDYYTTLAGQGVKSDVARDVLMTGVEKSSAKIQDMLEGVKDRLTDPAKRAAIQGVLSKYNVGGDRKVIGEKVLEMVKLINETNAKYLATEQQAGITVTQLLGDFGYVHRMFTDEAREAYALAHPEEIKGASSAYDISVRMSAQMQRSDQFRELTLKEINDKAQAGEWKSLFGDRKVKMFEDEPFHATYRRGTDSIDRVASADLVGKFVDKYGHVVSGSAEQPITAGHAPKGMSFLMPRISEDLGLRMTTTGGPEPGTLKVIRDVALPQDIVTLLNSHYERVINPAAMQPFLRGYDALQRMWKNLTLPIWPAYHSRNLMSDFFMITHGADSYGLHIPDAIKAITDGSRGLAGKLDSLDIRGEKFLWKDIRGLLDKYGLLDYQPNKELDDVVLRPKGLLNIKTGLAGLEERLSKTPIMEAGFRAGMYRQNATNAGYFIGLLRKGVSPEVAALEVKKRLFDFGDLTNFEKQVLRRVFPFYSWLRHNIPYQIAAITSKPRILTEVNWLRNAATGGRGPAGDIPLPSFLAQGLPAAVPGTSNFVRMKGLLPEADIMQAFNPVQEGWNSLSPLLKTPYEMIGNIDTFKNTPLEEYPGQAKTMFGAVPVSTRWAAPLIENVRPLYEVNNLLDPQRSLGQKLGGLGLAKAYGMDIQDQTRVMWSKVRAAEAQAKTAMRRAQMQGNAQEIIKLRQYIVDLHRNPRQVMH